MQRRAIHRELKDNLMVLNDFSLRCQAALAVIGAENVCPRGALYSERVRPHTIRKLCNLNCVTEDAVARTVSLTPRGRRVLRALEAEQ